MLFQGKYVKCALIYKITRFEQAYCNSWVLLYTPVTFPPLTISLKRPASSLTQIYSFLLSVTTMLQCTSVMYYADMLNTLLFSISCSITRAVLVLHNALLVGCVWSCICLLVCDRNVLPCPINPDSLCCLSGFCVCGLRCWLFTPVTRLWLLSPSPTTSCSRSSPPASLQRAASVCWLQSASVSDK